MGVIIRLSMYVLFNEMNRTVNNYSFTPCFQVDVKNGLVIKLI
ncbi:hypothetical protein Ga0061079_102234 [Apibacter mensalis]|uniref:Uncharacterized protein n=1 Tax=Apibacter mensalis TaxID=1586267 RepID=A0A0X3AN79_9FLAO|nr:hypothetical protein Ga0061079_102234 [Apibacter mensalis]